MEQRTLSTALGPMTATAEGGAVTRLRFGEEGPGATGTAAERALLERLAAELNEYALGQRRSFTLPLRPAGTPFQQRVWEALRSIPYGERRSYGEIAAVVGRPGAARAVGRACGANPIAVLLPCHRVVGKDGALTGYSARGGTRTKERLLALEERGEFESR